MSWRIDDLLSRQQKKPWERALLFPLYLISLPYGWAVRIRTLLYHLGLKHSNHLPCPVISVGNITVGGTGKTPLVMALAKGLAERGIRVAVLTRGYKRRKASVPVVIEGGSASISIEESGDEAYLMGQRLKETPILVGKDRVATGRTALQRFGVNGLLLDDGYQHLRLHRDLNILLIDSTIGFGDRHLLPRGILRESLVELRRADLILFTKEEHPETPHPLEEELRRFYPLLPVFHSYYEPLGLIGPGGESEDIHALRGKKVLLLAGIANPGYFGSLLKKCGSEVIKKVIFPDHYHYTQKDLDSIEEENKGMDWIVTTEKDMVKLANLDMGHLSVRALRIEMRIREGEKLFERVVKLFSHPGREQR